MHLYIYVTDKYMTMFFLLDFQFKFPPFEEIRCLTNWGKLNEKENSIKYIA